MRLLLDNCIPRGLVREFIGHDIAHVLDLGWDQHKDGDLLDVMSGEFDVLVTVDKSLRFQQRLDDRPFAVIVLRGRSNRIADLLPLVPALQEALNDIQPGEVREISA